MDIEIEDMGSYHLLRCSGILGGDIRVVSDESLHPLIEDNTARILVDLSGVDRITTDAIGAFVTLVSRANSKGSRIVFANPGPFVRAIFDATKITTFLETEDSIDAAVKRLLTED